MEIVRPMFPSIASREYSHILVGRQPQRMIRALEHIFDLSLQNPLVTYVAGDPGSGKSHTILNLEHRSLSDERRLVVVINANLFNPDLGHPLDRHGILAAVHQDPILRERAATPGVVLATSESKPSEGKMIEDINAVIVALNDADQRKTWKPFGLVIAVDGLDEYVRPSGGKLRGFDTETFILNVRFLLDSLERTCIMLSLTSSIFDEAYDFIRKDRTFLRRFIAPQEYDGTKLDFRSFSDTEVLLLFEEYRNFWLRNAPELDDKTMQAMRETGWPISHDAVLLAREATAGRPGPLQNILQSAFERLRIKFPSTWLNPSSVVDLFLMAELINLAARRAEPGVDISKEEFRRRIGFLAGWDEGIITLPKTISDTKFIGVLELLLAESGFEIKGGARPSRLSIGQVYVREVMKNGKAGKLGFLVALDSLPTDEDLRILNLLVATGAVHQLVVLTKRQDFDWIYSPRNYPVEYEGPGQRHLGNFSYVVRLGPEQIAGLALAGENLSTPDQGATLWILDRHYSPLSGYRLSGLLSSMAWNAIMVGTSG